jgi:hypothetical protein
MGRVLIANRNAYVIDTCFTFVDGHAERIAALAKIEPRADRPNRITRRTVDELRAMNMTPLMAQSPAGRAPRSLAASHHPHGSIGQQNRPCCAPGGYGCTLELSRRVGLR